MNYAEAIANLDSRVNMETGRLNDAPGLPPPDRTHVPARQLPIPSLDRVRAVLTYLGDPQLDVEFIHVTGTNGKGSTTRMAASLLEASGITVATFTSPHLERVNERLSRPGSSIPDDDFADLMRTVVHAEAASQQRCPYFEALTAAAFRWFSDLGVEAAVVEVGMGGRWDSTNAGDGSVAVVTNIELDHLEYLGTTREEIATEKSGIVKPDSVAIIGETDSVVGDLLVGLAAKADASAIWRRNVEFGCDSNRLALSGRILSLRTPGASYEDLFLPLHGRHQGDNAAIALAAAEAFLGEPLPPEVVKRGFGAVTHPGRMEVMRRKPLVLLDGAHNPAGARAAAVTLREEFASVDGRVLVVGLLKGRDPGVMLDALEASLAKLVIAVAPPSPRAMDPARIAATARELGIVSEVASTIEEALAIALGSVDEKELILVTGSLYLIGSARPILLRL